MPSINVYNFSVDQFGSSLPFIFIVISSSAQQDNRSDFKDSKTAMLLAVHSKAIEVRLKVETHYRAELERRGISYPA
jgi:hypothetical protein